MLRPVHVSGLGMHRYQFFNNRYKYEYFDDGTHRYRVLIQVQAENLSNAIQATLNVIFTFHFNKHQILQPLEQFKTFLTVV